MSDPFDQIDIQPADVVGMRLNMNGGRDAVQNMQCVKPPLGCGRDISFEEFERWDGLTQKEYTMSGWCTTCQDKVYKDPDAVEECTHEGTCEEWSAAMDLAMLDPNVEVPYPDGVCACTCDNPCCEADIGVGVINCGSQHCRVHGTDK